MQLVDRQAWGAAAPRDQYSPLRNPKGTVIHWFGGDTPKNADHSACSGMVRGIQQGAFDKDWADIPYNLLACVHGFVFVGRGVGVIPAAQLQYNAEYYAVCAITGPSGGWTSPTDALLNALCDAIDDCRQTGAAGSLVVTHRSLIQTDCPGDALTAWVNAGAHRPGSTPTPPPPGGGTHHTLGKWPAWDSTLYGLAAHYYHNGEQWPRIYDANKGTIGDNPDLVQPGMNLIIP